MLSRRGWVVFAVALVWHAPAHAGRDPLGDNPSTTKPDLVVPKPGADLSAYRLDCDVFGWDRDFTQMAALGTEIYRGPRGKHRGEAYLLVYNVGESVPVHNVIVHNITHADLPHDPIPIEDARDLMWTIEWSYQKMWPKRPLYKRPQGGMSVETLYQPQPRDGLCVPGVGFTLAYNGKHRFVPFAQLDMRASCELLHQTDARIYWGRKDVAAAMVRVDFSPQEMNEKSARFAVSATWKLGRELNVVLETAAPLPAARRKSLEASLGKLGRLRVRRLPSETAGANEIPMVTTVATRAAYTQLGAYLQRTLMAAGTAGLGDEGPDVVVHVGYGKPLPPPAPAAVAPPPAAALPDTAPRANAAEIDAAARATVRMSAMPEPTPAAASTQTPVAAPQPQYIKDWRLP